MDGQTGCAADAVYWHSQQQTARTQPHQSNPLQQNGCSTGNTVRCKARLNDWPPDTTWPTSCPAISEMNRHRSANRVNWDSAKTGPSKLDSSCQTYHTDVNQNSQTFRSWNNSFWDAVMKVTCISILTLTTITNLCLYNIHEPKNSFSKIKFMTNIYLPTCYNTPVPKRVWDSDAITDRRWIFVINCIF